MVFHYACVCEIPEQRLNPSFSAYVYAAEPCSKKQNSLPYKNYVFNTNSAFAPVAVPTRCLCKYVQVSKSTTGMHCIR